MMSKSVSRLMCDGSLLHDVCSAVRVYVMTKHRWRISARQQRPSLRHSTILCFI